MPTVNEGASAEVTVAAGKRLVVSTDGEAYIDRLTELTDAGYASDRVVDGEREYQARDRAFLVRVRAISAAATYTVSFPEVASSDVVYRRNDSGAIDALIDPQSGAAVTFGIPDDLTVAWDDVTDKPTFGTAAQADTGDFATAAQGATADSAVQPGDLATVATSGAYSDLTGAPQGTAIANAVDENDIIDQFNGLLASLRTAGLIAT